MPLGGGLRCLALVLSEIRDQQYNIMSQPNQSIVVSRLSRDVTNEKASLWVQERPAMFYLKSIQSEMIGLKRRLDVADFRFSMLLWDIHKQVRC